MNIPGTTVTMRMPGPAILLFYLSVVVIVALFLEPFLFLAHDYWAITERFSKGPVIWVISLFIIHRELARSRMRRDILGRDLPIFAAVAALVLITAWLQPMITPTILVIYGWYLLSDRVKPSLLLMVWLFLLFSLPYFSIYVGLVLQPLTVWVTEGLLRMTGIPVLVQEYFIAIPAGLFEVEESCNGGRYLANNLILAFLYSFLSRFNLAEYGKALLVGTILAMVVNWIRVTLIILIAHWYGIDDPWVRDHADLGWILYAISLFPYFYLLLRIERQNIITAARAADPADPNRLLAVPTVSLLAPIFLGVILLGLLTNA